MDLFTLRFFENLMWLLVWLVATLFATEVLCIVLLVLRGRRAKQRYETTGGEIAYRAR
jgi:hypothetical protein